MIKAVICDFDFTIYSHLKRCIPPSAMEALKKLKENGIKIILATGRNRSELYPFPEILEIGFDGYVLMNGQICLDENMNKLIGEPFKGKSLEILVNLFTSKKQPMVFCDENDNYINFYNPIVDEALGNLTGLDYEIKDYSGNPPYLAVAYVTEEEQDAFLSSIPGCDIKRWGRLGVDIVPKGIDKNVGISFLLKRFGISPEECMTVGDSYNDIGMIKFAGIGVAMGNGEQALKNAADFVTSDIDENGLANAFKHYNLI